MTARELAEKLLALSDPDVEVTVNVWDRDYSEENEVESLIDWGSFVSIQHGPKVPR